MFAATMRKWFGVQSNYKDDLYQSRTIRGNWLGRRYELTVGGKHNHWCAYYRADRDGALMIRFAKLAFWMATRKKKKDLEFFENEGAPTWGWNIMDGDFVLYLGNEPPRGDKCITMRSRSVNIPLPFTWHKHKDYQYVKFASNLRSRWVQTVNPPIPKIYYRTWEQHIVYVTATGETQQTLAKMTLSKRVFRRAWFKWLPWERRERYVHLTFDTPIGHDRSGWKGGVYGGSVLVGERETPPMVLQRLIRERHYG